MGEHSDNFLTSYLKLKSKIRDLIIGNIVISIRDQIMKGNKMAKDDPAEKVKIKRCFKTYFDKWDIPETYTTDSAKTYIWNLKGE